MTTTRFILLLIITFLSGNVIQAELVGDTVVIYYHLGRSDFDPDLRGNRVSLHTFLANFKNALGDPEAKDLSIRLDAYSSPDGSSAANRRLSEKRAQRLLRTLRSHTSFPDSILTVNAHGVDWEGLDSLVASRCDLPHRDEILDVIRNTPEWIFDKSRRIVDGRKRRLMRLHGGGTYRQLMREIFPLLRRSSVITFSYVRDEKPVAEETDDTVSVSIPARRNKSGIPHIPCDSLRKQTEGDNILPTDSVRFPGREFFRPKLAIKTNLSDWAGIMSDFRSYSFLPNIEAEWFFADRWSVAADGAYTDHTYGHGNLFALSVWSLEPRLWVWGDSRFRRLHIGIYGQAGDYDIRNSRTDFDGVTGNFWSSGLSLGVIIPFTDRLGLDLGMRGGLRHSTVRYYTHEEGYDYLERHTSDKFWGITGINVSLYWRFGNTVKRERP